MVVESTKQPETKSSLGGFQCTSGVYEVVIICPRHVAVNFAGERPPK